MKKPCRDGPTSNLDLPDDFIYVIFQKLVCASDRESFGLTCRHWLHILNLCRKSLQFHRPSSPLSRDLPHTPASICSFRLHKLLNRFKHLESLSLFCCLYFPDAGLTPLKHRGSELHTLCLDWCLGITDYGLSLIASGCPSLTVISLCRCNITDIGLETLAKSLLLLKDVNLAYCPRISDNGIRALSENCRQLRGVRISKCRGINGVSFKGCSQTLSYVDASYCKLEPEGILGIVSGGGLEYLNVLGSSSPIHGNGLESLGAGSASNLGILNFCLCSKVSEEAIMVISKGCPLLQDWNLASCSEVGIPGWESIGLNCRNLERLHVNGCLKLCDLGLLALRNGCKKLSVLYLTDTILITSTAIEEFKSLRDDVVIEEEEMRCIAPIWVF